MANQKVNVNLFFKLFCFFTLKNASFKTKMDKAGRTPFVSRFITIYLFNNYFNIIWKSRALKLLCDVFWHCVKETGFNQYRLGSTQVSRQVFLVHSEFIGDVFSVLSCSCALIASAASPTHSCSSADDRPQFWNARPEIVSLVYN